MLRKTAAQHGRRRVPAQARSRERFEQILDAAANLFADDGLEATTMEAIAERADTSIGSLYQFFSNKQAIFEALTERWRDNSRGLFDELLPVSALDRPLPELIDDVVDAFVALQARDPGYRAIVLDRQRYGAMSEANDEVHREFVKRTRALIAVKAPDLPRSRRDLVANMIVHIISSVLLFPVRDDPSLARRMLRETKTVLRRYLDPGG